MHSEAAQEQRIALYESDQYAIASPVVPEVLHGEGAEADR